MIADSDTIVLSLFADVPRLSFTFVETSLNMGEYGGLHETNGREMRNGGAAVDSSPGK